jgi:hypothetical protein
MKLLLTLLLLLSLVSCGSGDTAGPSVPEASAGIGASPPAEAAPGERFRQITSRPLNDWTTGDFTELLGMSSRALGVALANHAGGRNLLLSTVGGNVNFDFLNADTAVSGWLTYAHYKDTGGEIYPSAVTIGFDPEESLLGLDLEKSTLGDVREHFEGTTLEYVTRTGGGVEANIYFVRYPADGLIFLFEGELTAERGAALPGVDEILAGGVANVHVVSGDYGYLDWYIKNWVMPLPAGGTAPAAESTESPSQDLDFLVSEITAMHNAISAGYLHEPYLHIALADLDFDGCPEFFYGYQTITASHNKIWYRAYSLKNRAVIPSGHPPDWNTYLDDEECAFFTGPESFIDGYFPDSRGNPNFVAIAPAGAVTDTRADTVTMRYQNGGLIVETPVLTAKSIADAEGQCQNLTPLTQVCVKTEAGSLEADIPALYQAYSDKAKDSASASASASESF